MERSEREAAPVVDPILDVVIVGAGVSGIAMARALDQAGRARWLLLEREAGLGGVWRDNRYPGAGCDIPSQLYSFSFALNPDWSRRFARQPEILAYLEACADRLGLRDRMRFGCAVVSAAWDEGARVWSLHTHAGETIRARVLITAVGQLNTPAQPVLAGAETFSGPAFHSARWPHDLHLAGKRVCVVGSAASAIQFLPEIAKEAAAVTVFQRTPNWFVAKPDRAFTAFERFLFRHAPGFQRLYRALLFWEHESRLLAFFNALPLIQRLALMRVRAYLRAHVRDAEMAARVTPDYPPGCKRVLLSNDYFATLDQDHVSLVTEPIARVEADAVIDAGGRAHAADVLIYATGFQASNFLAGLTVIGRSGRSLSEVWSGTARAYRGLAVPGFPNFFMLYGPNTNLGHNSIIAMVEREAAYVVRRLERLDALGWAAADVRAEAYDAYNTQLQRDLQGTVWASACGAWYANADGVVTSNWSSFVTRYGALLAEPDDAAYQPA